LDEHPLSDQGPLLRDADQPAPLLEARLWAAFAAAETSGALHRAWLALICRALPGAQRAALLRAEPDGTFSPAAVWPDASGTFEPLRAIAEQCIGSGHPAILSNHPGLVHIGYPFFGNAGKIAGAVLTELERESDDATQRAVRTLHMGVGWLEAQALRDESAASRAAMERSAAALDIVAVANEHERPDAAAIAVSNEIALRLGVARVAIGLWDGRKNRLTALSHTAWFKRGTALVTAIEDAMDEAVEQRATVWLPASPGEPVRITVAHTRLRAVWKQSAALATVPIVAGDRQAGALLLAQDTGSPAILSEEQVRLAQAAAALVGPALAAKAKARRWISGRIADGVGEVLRGVIGPRHVAWKLLAAAVLAALAVTSVVPTAFRVSARAVLEGHIQRAVPAPFDGFIATALLRAGDIVHEGDVLATLDDKDLALERARWTGERDQALQKARDATARHDRAAASEFEAQSRQADAQLALTADKLARSRIVAPIDGLVVTGDLSQMIGGPVETGKVLFEIAPLDFWRVVVRVDERDVRFIHPPQPGVLVLGGMSGATLPLTLNRITSVAETDNGRNAFRGEADLDDNADASGLRPGMEGIAKIEVGHRAILAVWTRSLMDWLRMQMWTWTP
jgi:hypothetical protein